MREVNSTENNSGSNKKKKVIITIVAIVILLILFFVSFIVAYNIMTKDSKKLNEQQIGTTNDATLNEKQLREKIATLETENEQLKAQIDKYKAMAGSSSVPVIKASPKPSLNPSPSPKATPKPEAIDSETVTAPTSTPNPSATPKAESHVKLPNPTATPVATQIPND